MVLRKALEESEVGAAQRPYGEGSNNKIVLCEEFWDVYVTDEHGNSVRNITEEDKFRVVGRDDWEPIKPRKVE